MAKAASKSSVDELDGLIEALGKEKHRSGSWYGVEFDNSKTGAKLMALDRGKQAEAVDRIVDQVLSGWTGSLYNST